MAGKTTLTPLSGQGKAVSAKKKAVQPGKRKKPKQAAVKLQAPEDSGPDVSLVGVGASAGGLEALIDLFKPLPTDSRFSFVVIQHLSSRYKSTMDQLLSRATDLPIIPIKNNLAIKPGCIYLAPPEKFVTITKSRFRIQPPRSLGSGVPLPIDHFFTTLAQSRQERAIGVILSGLASDGTQGLKAIKAAGGLTIVQSPDDATHASMPESAMATHMHITAITAESHRHDYAAKARLLQRGKKWPLRNRPHPQKWGTDTRWGVCIDAGGHQSSTGWFRNF